GRGYALLPNISFHFIRKKWLQANFRFGAGLGYIEKPFDRINNYKNNAIGSHLNSAISVLIETKFKLSSHSNLGIGLAMNHFSNGATKTPNLGINLASANIAYAYTFGQRSTKFQDSSEHFEKHFEYFAVLSSGFKEIAPPGGNKYSIYSVSLNMARVHSLRGKWCVGLDMLNDGALQNQLSQNGKNQSRIGVTQAGLTLGWEVVVGKVSFPLQAGVYLVSKYKSNGSIYNRYGIRYHFHKRLFANVSLKTHYAKADYFEWGLGIKL
ncbi:MAG TPA: acyloxyacyl hydrolase, partial [Gammaproteobacteria bacterium]|nr:acyloxyacyl hydrolase [Gammaproteobacteria bacterium]